MAYLLQQLANAVPLAALYAALAFGYAIGFGVTRRADISYGALYAFSGQLLLLFTDFGYNRMFLILPAALAFGGALAAVYTVGAGLFIGRTIMQPLAKKSPNTVIVAALGMVIVLGETARLASDARSIWLPPLMSRSIVFWDDGAFKVALTQLQLLNIGLMAAIVLCGAAIMRYTSWGRIWRAVTDDALAAELCGASAARVFLVAYGASTLIATLCGILSTSYYGTMDFSVGLLFGLKVLMIAAAGGYSDPLKSAGGAALVGVAETLWGAYGPLMWREMVIFSALVLVLVLSRRERAIP